MDLSVFSPFHSLVKVVLALGPAIWHQILLTSLRLSIGGWGVSACDGVKGPACVSKSADDRQNKTNRGQLCQRAHVSGARTLPANGWNGSKNSTHRICWRARPRARAFPLPSLLSTTPAYMRPGLPGAITARQQQIGESGSATGHACRKSVWRNADQLATRSEGD